jgi:hypothetical protein
MMAKLNGSLQKIAIKAEQRQFLCPAEVEGWRPDWKDWVLLESKRRLLLSIPPFAKVKFADKRTGR